MGKLYDNINSLCVERGIKPSKLCADVGISRGLITDLKMGRKNGVTAVTAQKIASYFNVSVGYLLGEETEKAPTGASERKQEADILDEVDVAFYGEYKQLNEDDKATLRDMARILRERRARQQEK